MYNINVSIFILNYKKFSSFNFNSIQFKFIKNYKNYFERKI